MSEAAQLFMLKILPEMDDYGRIAWLPKKIAGSLYPYREDIGPQEINTLAGELEAEGILVRYEVGGKQYAHFPKWKDHQRVINPGKETLPGPETPSIEAVEQSYLDSNETLNRVESLERDKGDRNREEDIGKGEGVTANAIAVAEPSPPENEPYRSVHAVLFTANQQLRVDPPEPADGEVKRYLAKGSPIRKLLDQYKTPAKVAGLYLYFVQNRKYGDKSWAALASQHAAVYGELMASRKPSSALDRATEKHRLLNGEGAAA